MGFINQLRTGEHYPDGDVNCFWLPQPQVIDDKKVGNWKIVGNY